MTLEGNFKVPTRCDNHTTRRPSLSSIRCNIHIFFTIHFSYLPLLISFIISFLLSLSLSFSLLSFLFFYLNILSAAGCTAKSTGSNFHGRWWVYLQALQYTRAHPIIRQRFKDSQFLSSIALYSLSFSLSLSPYLTKLHKFSLRQLTVPS